MNQPETIKKRLQKVDLFRGLALLGMVIYHFSWDLSYFSYIAPQIPAEGSLRLLARVVAFCFLFISGFSLFLAQGKKLHPKAFSRRLLIIVLAAFLVSLATYFIMPQGFIYFGILHEIALASIIGLFFLYTPIWLNFIALAIFAILPLVFKSDLFNAPYFLWLGLSTYPRPSFDYVPVFPWFAAALLGLTVARICYRFDLLSCLQNGVAPHWLNTFLQLIGRHSLIFYLVHQPILLAFVYCISLIFPSSPDALRAPMENACINECHQSQPDNRLCTNFCGCVFDKIEEQNLIPAFSKGEITENDDRLQKPVNECWGRIIGKME